MKFQGATRPREFKWILANCAHPVHAWAPSCTNRTPCPAPCPRMFSCAAPLHGHAHLHTSRVCTAHFCPPVLAYLAPSYLYIPSVSLHVSTLHLALACSGIFDRNAFQVPAHHKHDSQGTLKEYVQSRAGMGRDRLVLHLVGVYNNIKAV